MIKKGLMSIIKIFGFILIVLLLAYLFKTSQTFGYHIFDDRPKDVPGSPTVVKAVITYTENESLMELGEDLEKKGIIRDKLAFVVAVRCMENYNKIIPGVHDLDSGMKPSEILKKMTTPREE